MNARAMLAIVRKDLKVVSQNKGVIIPIILLPLILFVILPWIVTLMPLLGDSFGITPDNLNKIQVHLPPGQYWLKYHLSVLVLGYDLYIL